jgi:hypothetical protein
MQPPTHADAGCVENVLAGERPESCLDEYDVLLRIPSYTLVVQIRVLGEAVYGYEHSFAHKHISRIWVRVVSFTRPTLHT